MPFPSTYLESESEEVHDVINCGCVFDVSAVDVHGVLELLGPSLVVHTHLVNVGVGHQHQLVQNRVEFRTMEVWWS